MVSSITHNAVWLLAQTDKVPKLQRSCYYQHQHHHAYHFIDGRIANPRPCHYSAQLCHIDTLHAGSLNWAFAVSSTSMLDVSWIRCYVKEQAWKKKLLLWVLSPMFEILEIVFHCNCASNVLLWCQHNTQPLTSHKKNDNTAPTN